MMARYANNTKNTNKNLSRKKVRFDEQKNVRVEVESHSRSTYLEYDVTGAYKKLSMEDFPCICNRKKSGVYCGYCKSFTPDVGIRQTCPQHPLTLKLMDLVECPKCSRDADLQELPAEENA
ncbi:unnamed protein product [Bemisia tabaci]|uniref:Uncharacterized protein n=1 Tax=Bemisia tabaci TaxID=7038 RepID=A0A9P0A8A1_BEMTA|nr:unnamed protein product [Bemisia tabaci]